MLGACSFAARLPDLFLLRAGKLIFMSLNCLGPDYWMKCLLYVTLLWFPFYGEAGLATIMNKYDLFYSSPNALEVASEGGSHCLFFVSFSKADKNIFIAGDLKNKIKELMADFYFVFNF